MEGALSTVRANAGRLLSDMLDAHACARVMGYVPELLDAAATAVQVWSV